MYEHAKRVGSGLDEQVLDDIGEQVSLRQFDISDRNSDRFSGIVQVMPVSALSFNGTVSVGKEERPGTVFGLRSNDNHAYSVGVDFVPRDAVSLGLSYEYETYAALQASRQANPGVQFDDPTRDWTTDGNDKGAHGHGVDGSDQAVAEDRRPLRLQLQPRRSRPTSTAWRRIRRCRRSCSCRPSSTSSSAAPSMPGTT